MQHVRHHHDLRPPKPALAYVNQTYEVEAKRRYKNTYRNRLRGCGERPDKL